MKNYKQESNITEAVCFAVAGNITDISFLNELFIDFSTIDFLCLLDGF